MSVPREYIISSPFPDIPIPQVDCYSFITADFPLYHDRIALVDAVTGEEITYKRLQNNIDSVADNLYDLGFRKGGTMAIYALNCPEYVTLTLAVWKLGGIVTVINNLLTGEEVKREITRTKSQYLFCTGTQLAAVEKLLPDTPVKIVITKDETTKWIPFSKILTKREPSKSSALKEFHTGVNDPISIFFSSGTTGLPKGVVLTNKNFVSKFHAWRVSMSSDQFLVSGFQSVVLFHPLSHIYGATMVLQALLVGSTCVIMPKFELESYLRLNSQYKCELMALVPPLVILMVKNKDLVRKYDLSHTRIIFCGAAPLALEAERELLQLISSEEAGIIGQGYGMTETTAGICTTPSVLFMKKRTFSGRQHNVGVPYPNIKVKIVDPENGLSLPPGRPGEICFKGPNIMSGYLDNKEATDRTIDASGWLHSGDIGFHDDNGYLYVIDRLKELIKYKAYQVAPAELEDVVLSHPKVADVGVVGVPDEEGGEVPLAFVVCKPGMEASAEEIIAYVAGKVSPYKKLRGGVRFVAQIPKSPSGKVLRREIKRLLGLTKSNL